MESNKQLRSVIEWSNPDPDLLFEKWTEDGDEIKNASKLIVSPGQGCLFVYEGKVDSCFDQEGMYDLKTANIPFWTNLKNILYKFESYHKVGLYFYRKAAIMNKRWGTPSPITYNDPKYKFPVGLGAFGNFSFSINKAVDFFRNAVGSLNVYNVRDIQEILLSRITQPMSDYLANAQFSYAEIDKHRNEIAKYCFDATKDIFSNLGFTLDDFRIEGTNFDEATQGRIGKIADMSAEAQAIQELGISYEQYQKLGAMRDLAKNEGGGNMGMQFGMGMEMSKMFTNNQQPTNNQQTNNQQSASSNTPMDEAMQKLEKLKKMFEMGLIDESEYKAKKQEIMSQL